MLVSRGPKAAARSSTAAGFTLLQLLAALVIVAILAAIAVPGYYMYLERARRARAIGELGRIELAINAFSAANDGQLPADLAAVGHAGDLDPWGGAWVYVNLALGGAPRVDQDGTPVNADYDLYSTGPDGATELSLVAGASEDDIIRASDGGFVGLVSDYTRLD